MKKFEKPEMEVIVFEAEDIITTSPVSPAAFSDESYNENHEAEATEYLEEYAGSQFEQEHQDAAEDQTVEEGAVQVEEQVGSEEQVVEEVEVLPEVSDGM